ncbi:MAG TPA: hypothetical protein VLY23_06850 [Candidatus Acidoferrum sp.]|nr:hypothetical protein [Candidatus Acidoferrum sp.]
MKVLKVVLFCLACATAFCVAAAASCVLRAKYSSVPELKSKFAYMYAVNLARYSFLQYNQASPDQGRKALLEYLKLLQRIRDEKIQYPQGTLHRNFGLTYLRLYRLESTAGNSAAADAYMKSAQKEWSALGWKDKDVSAEGLSKLIELRESNEQKLYNDAGVQMRAVQRKEHKSNERPK